MKKPTAKDLELIDSIVARSRIWLEFMRMAGADPDVKTIDEFCLGIRKEIVALGYTEDRATTMMEWIADKLGAYEN